MGAKERTPELLPIYYSVSLYNSTTPSTRYVCAGQKANVFNTQRPDLKAPTLNVSILEKSLVTPGHIIVSPYFTAGYRPDSAPYIFSNNGVSFNQVIFLKM